MDFVGENYWSHQARRNTISLNRDYRNRSLHGIEATGMRILFASAVLTAAVVKGVLIGVAIGAAATTCARCASRGLRRESREAGVAERQGKANGQE
jgi:hypothetical protein